MSTLSVPGAAATDLNSSPQSQPSQPRSSPRRRRAPTHGDMLLSPSDSRRSLNGTSKKKKQPSPAPSVTPSPSVSDNDEISAAEASDATIAGSVNKNKNKKKNKKKGGKNNKSKTDEIVILDDEKDPDNMSETEQSNQRSNKGGGNTSEVYQFFHNAHKGKGEKKAAASCKFCDKPIAGHNSSNLWSHLRNCAMRDKVLESASGSDELTAVLAKQQVYPTKKKPDSKLIINENGLSSSKQFSNVKLRDLLIDFFTVGDIPLSKVELPEFGAFVKYLREEAKLCSRSTLTRDLVDRYHELSNEQLERFKRLEKDGVLVHTMQDTWTDKGMRHSYIGHIATFVNENFEFEEVLLKFRELPDGHGSAALAKEIYRIWKKFELVDHLGTCTADNASANIKAYKALADKVLLDHVESESLSLPCVNHVINLACGAFFVGASYLHPDDYEEFIADSQNINFTVTTPEGDVEPVVVDERDSDSDERLVDTSDFTEADNLPSESEAEGEVVEISGGVGGDKVLNINEILKKRRAESKLAKAKAKADRKAFEASSPVGKVREAAKHVRGSPERRAAWKQAAEMMKVDILLLILDVATRWNSTLDCLVRFIEQYKVYEQYVLIEKDSPNPPPEFSKEDLLHIKRVINVLKNFKIFTLHFSAADVRADTVLFAFDSMIKALEKQRDEEQVPASWKAALQLAIAKLHKYFSRLLDNHFIGAAIALNPKFGFRALKAVYERYDRAYRLLETKSFIRRLLQTYKRRHEVLDQGDDSEVEIVESQSTEAFELSFAEYEQQPSSAPKEDELDRFEREASPLPPPKHTAMAYWKGASTEYPGLAWVARCVYGASATSTSVERLFSTAASTIRNRDNLSARKFAQQVTVKVYLRTKKAKSTKRAAPEKPQDQPSKKQKVSGKGEKGKGKGKGAQATD